VSDWVKRAYDPRTDEDGVVYLWLKSYAHTERNIARGAHKDHSIAENAYWREHAPIVESILRRATTTVLCDPDRVHASEAGPPVFWAFACTEGSVVHYVSVKRRYAREGFGPEMLEDLLGPMLKQACTTSHELVEMGSEIPARHRDRMKPAVGVMVPGQWRHDPWFCYRREVGGARKAA